MKKILVYALPVISRIVDEESKKASEQMGNENQEEDGDKEADCSAEGLHPVLTSRRDLGSAAAIVSL
jgi:hypothetical protein